MGARQVTTWSSLHARRRVVLAGARGGGELVHPLYRRFVVSSVLTPSPDSSTGAAIGLNASIISIITVFLSDLKLGHCSGAWWLNKKFCCWEMEDSCTDWLTWTSWSGIQWGMYVGFAVRSLPSLRT